MNKFFLFFFLITLIFTMKNNVCHAMRDTNSSEYQQILIQHERQETNDKIEKKSKEIAGILAKYFRKSKMWCKCFPKDGSVSFYVPMKKIDHGFKFNSKSYNKTEQKIRRYQFVEALYKAINLFKSQMALSEYQLKFSIKVRKDGVLVTALNPDDEEIISVNLKKLTTIESKKRLEASKKKKEKAKDREEIVRTIKGIGEKILIICDRFFVGFIEPFGDPMPQQEAYERQLNLFP